MENEKTYLITVKYNDSFSKTAYKRCKRIKATKLYKWYLSELNRGICQSIRTQIIKE